MHGLTQGGIGVLRGDKSVHGFVAGFVGDLTGTALEGTGTIESRTVISAGLTQIAVEAAGGEGNQWAVVGALVHLFNAEDVGNAQKERACAARPCVDRENGGTPGENAKYKVALAPGMGAKFKLFGLEAEVLNINAMEGIEGNFTGEYNTFLEVNLSPLILRAGEHSVGLGWGTHAVLTGDGNSVFESDWTPGYSRGSLWH